MALFGTRKLTDDDRRRRETNGYNAYLNFLRQNGITGGTANGNSAGSGGAKKPGATGSAVIPTVGAGANGSILSPTGTVNNAGNLLATGGTNSNSGAGGTSLSSLYNQVMGYAPFQYDLNGDLLYRQMADQYTQLGQKAMKDTMGTAAGLTGGYGNSWAQSVGQQAYQDYLTALNSEIPNLQQNAYNMWAGGLDQLMAQFDAALAYQQYKDAQAEKAKSGGGGGSGGSGGDDSTESDDESTTQKWTGIGGFPATLGALTGVAPGGFGDVLPVVNPLADYYTGLVGTMPGTQGTPALPDSGYAALATQIIEELMKGR